VDTLDPLKAAPAGALSSPAAARNIAPIGRVLAAHMPARADVLEVASGTGEHAVAFTAALPGLTWQPSDPSPEARASIAAHRAASPCAHRLLEPIALDAADDATWPTRQFGAIVCLNMVHISPWTATEGLMRLAGERLNQPGGLLYLYGPYLEDGVPVAPSNAAFDHSLKARNPAWGLRSVEAVEAVSRQHGLRLTARIAMPANNLSLILRRL
jgi:hypothetical protein